MEPQAVNKPFNVSLTPNTLTQTINPWAWSFGQVGLFNINLGSSGDPKVEALILDEVGSYGRQLGRLSDVIEVLVARLDRNTLTKPELDAVEAFEQQLKDVRQVKAEAGASASGAGSGLGARASGPR